MNITAPAFDEDEIRQLRACLDSGWVTQGPYVKRFEALMAARHEVRYALATTSCTAALHLATTALGLGPGDEVIVPAFTWITSANCAEYVGAKVVFADVDIDTYNINPEAIEAALTPQTHAIVAVHLFGLAAPMDEILAIARKRGIAVIEDAACAIGTTYNGRPVGVIGDVGCFSFHPRKVVTTGEGGMVTTDNDDIAACITSLRNHGATGQPSPELEPHGPWTMATFNRLGYNLRVSDIQAAVGVAQMAKLDRLLAERKRLAERYNDQLRDVEGLVIPATKGDIAGHTYQSYIVRLQDGGRTRRNRIMAVLDGEGIQTRPGTHAVHCLGYYRQKYGLKPEDFPVAALCEDTTITLPIFPGMTDDQQDRVVEVLRKALNDSG
ncbi:MAG: DegT/DnrJ/EryC1/StrS family aminotransferase [Pyrinomonadaceae bacterium]